jgi:type IV pilus assembly protein PilA
MIHWLRSRLGNEEGFTLVELMVVVLIIAILVAIAIPTFLGARESAQDRAAQSDLRNALTAEKVFYVDNEFYTNDTAAGGALETIEPSITWADITVSVAGTAGAEQEVCLEITSASGTVFVLRDVASATGAGAGSVPGTFYGQVNCAGATFTTADTGW